MPPGRLAARLARERTAGPLSPRHLETAVGRGAIPEAVGAAGAAELDEAGCQVESLEGRKIKYRDPKSGSWSTGMVRHHGLSGHGKYQIVYGSGKQLWCVHLCAAAVGGVCCWCYGHHRCVMEFETT